jgi:hypothetical protein
MDTPAYEPEVFRLPFPGDFDDDSYETLQARASALFGAAECIFQKATESGQTIVIDDATRVTTRDVFAGAMPLSTIRTTAEAIHLTALLNSYDVAVVQNAQQVRNFCTNILIDIAGDDGNKNSDRLNAVKMLGQIKDVALFEERSTILVQNMTTDQIKSALKDKLATIRQRATADAVDVQAHEVHDEIRPTTV